MLIIISMFTTTVTAFRHTNNTSEAEPITEDIDPLVDIAVTVTIQEIRAYDRIDLLTDPDFYVKVFINGVEDTSPIWHNQRYVKPQWSTTQNVPDTEENVEITIQLWDWNILKDKKCDISYNTQTDPLSYDVDLVYNLKTGHWRGDDYVSPEPIMFDRSGYGRLNGCDDNTIYENDRDCEVLFDISYNDYDNDTIPYWTEVYVYGTDPTVSDKGKDYDNDGIPIEWEHKWGHSFVRTSWDPPVYDHRWFYDPFIADNHSSLDPDNDGLNNIEEYYTSQWRSDPFRKDLFVELDQMEAGPNGEGGKPIPQLTKDLLRDAFSKHNIVYHLDDGSMGGGEFIPFDNATSSQELQDIYLNYFMNNNVSYWRRGVFHYALIIYHSDRYPGFAFGTSVDGETYCTDSFQLSTKMHDEFPFRFPLLGAIVRGGLDYDHQRAVSYASVMMHETGHTLGIFSGNVAGCDGYYSTFPRRDWWKWIRYRSCMNYQYCYALVDYSDGSHGKNDFDDWGNIDLTFFQREVMWH